LTAKFAKELAKNAKKYLPLIFLFNSNDSN